MYVFLLEIEVTVLFEGKKSKIIPKLKNVNI
jgi:hypothetical protein